MNVKSLLIFTAGCAVGGLTAWLCTKNHYKSISDEEVKSLREAFNDEREQHKKQVREMEELFYEDLKSEYESKKNGPANPELFESPTETGLCVKEITQDEFDDLPAIYDKEDLVYYKGDGVLLDIYDQYVDITDSITHPLCREFAENEDVEEMYVLNTKIGTAYSITKNENSAAEALGGEFDGV